jgi:MYXO-CTERM domain-containing protein
VVGGVGAAGDIDGDGDIDAVLCATRLEVYMCGRRDDWAAPAVLSNELCDEEIEAAPGDDSDATAGCAPGETDAVGPADAPDAAADTEAAGCGCASAGAGGPAGLGVLLLGLARMRARPATRVSDASSTP